MISTQDAGQPDGVTRPQHKWTPGWVIATGLILAAAGYALGQTTLLVAYTGGRTVSQVNGICTSSLGQFAQVLRPSLSGRCGQVAMYEQFHGWLIVTGVAVVAAGIAWRIYRQKDSASA